MSEELNNFKAGFVSIIGKPNVGKSSLMNAFLGEKLSITTPKPQTTRQNLLGILSEDAHQVVFIDTPGFLKPRYLLQEKMQSSIAEALKDVEVLIFISDVETFPTNYDRAVSEIILKSKIPKLAVINKIDLAKKEKILKDIQQTLEVWGFKEIFFISATECIGLAELKSRIIALLPVHPPYYPMDNISDRNMRFFVQEIIREKIFYNLQQEIPYSTAVTVEMFEEGEERSEVWANIFVESRSQKKIIIGTNGEMIKKIRLAAERDIKYLMQKKVRLHLWVKIRKNWRKKERVLKEFGYK
ncbi:MAG TPA: GTPase Era [Candidatus Cloacimonetes bacterium]|nr:GTPase Era [Candidatus Cloacimonadota bacterium]HEX37292.1 GTPase Era [Candidatus Cloacimonadota bacterium]